MMKILCYVRPWNYEQFKCLAENFSIGSNISFCSEHSSVDSSGLSSGYYEYLKSKERCSELSKEEISDFILRCRLLRKLPRKKSVRHLVAMEYSVKDVLRREKPAVLLSLMVDSYVIDLLRHFSERCGARFIGIVPTFVNGHFRVTARGEANTNSGFDLSVVPEVKSKLLDPLYAPAFNSKALANPRRGVWRRWAANMARVPYFFAKRFLTGDRYNYHYWAAQLVSWEQFNVLPPADPGNPDWEEQLASDPRPTLYIPLQMFPEATIDYWCEDPVVVDYYQTLEMFIAKHSQAFNILVKEHPSVMGSRPFGFYRRLKSDQRITVIPTYTPSNLVLDKADCVMIWTGSVGYEAALRGKAVFSMAAPYYAQGPRFKKITTQTDSFVLLEHIQWAQSQEVSNEEQNELLGYLVKQLVCGAFKNNGTWSASCAEDVKNCKMMASGLRIFFDQSIQ